MTIDPRMQNLRQVLLEDWDPHSVQPRPEAHGAYDTYLQPLIELVDGGADVNAVIDWLSERERESMCFPALGRQRLQRVGQRIIRTLTSGR